MLTADDWDLLWFPGTRVELLADQPGYQLAGRRGEIIAWEAPPRWYLPDVGYPLEGGVHVFLDRPARHKLSGLWEDLFTVHVDRLRRLDQQDVTEGVRW